jgi:hypothetical protein
MGRRIDGQSNDDERPPSAGKQSQNRVHSQSSLDLKTKFSHNKKSTA